jgi:hypothetical protein
LEWNPGNILTSLASFSFARFRNPAKRSSISSQPPQHFAFLTLIRGTRVTEARKFIAQSKYPLRSRVPGLKHDSHVGKAGVQHTGCVRFSKKGHRDAYGQQETELALRNVVSGCLSTWRCRLPACLLPGRNADASSDNWSLGLSQTGLFIRQMYGVYLALPSESPRKSCSLGLGNCTEAVQYMDAEMRSGSEHGPRRPCTCLRCTQHGVNLIRKIIRRACQACRACRACLLLISLRNVGSEGASRQQF